MRFALLSRPRTQAILDKSLKWHGPTVNWVPITDPLNWHLSSAAKPSGMISEGFDGGEMSISSFIQAKSQGAPLLALPIFLKRGLVEKSLYCSFGSALRSPDQLQGKRVGLVSYTSSMAVWMRGVLSETYKLPRANVKWFTLTATSHRIQSEINVIELPEASETSEIEAWEELDGYPHRLNRRERFLVSLAEKHDLDAIISFQTKIASDKIRPLVEAEDELWSRYRKNGVYPINHLFVLHEDVLRNFPQIGTLLLRTLRDARKAWLNYTSREQCDAMNKEIERLGQDPFAYRLGEGEKRSVETFVRYCWEDKLISQKLPVEGLFHQASLEAA